MTTFYLFVSGSNVLKSRKPRHRFLWLLSVLRYSYIKVIYIPYSNGKKYGLPSWLSQERNHLQCRRYKIPGFSPWVGKTPWRKKRQPTPVFLPGKSHWQRNLAGYSPWGCKESDSTESDKTPPMKKYRLLSTKIAWGKKNLVKLIQAWKTI